MKAQARKILALIMAMVMSLSLAAPAFAAEEAVEDTSAEASVVETVEAEETETEEAEAEESEEEVEAPKAEKKAKKSAKLAAQAVTEVQSFSVSGSVLTVKTDGDANGTAYDLKNGTDQLPKWVKWKIVERAHVGDSAAGRIVYHISVNTDDYAKAESFTGYESGKDYAAVTVPGEANNKVKLTETAVWTPDAATDFYFGTKQAKGFSWQEEQDDGTYKVFFKLATVENKTFKTGDDDWKYFVAYDSNSKAAKQYTSKLKDSDLSGALATAVEWNTTSESAEASKAVNNAGVTLDTAEPESTAYACTVINCTDVTVTASGANIEFGEFTDSEKDTGSFQVSIKATTGTGASAKESYLSASEVEEYVKKQLVSNCTVESVVAASGNYFTVTVKRNAKSADPVSTEKDLYNKGVIAWNKGTASKPVYVAGLYDIAEEKGGFYNGKDVDGADGVQIAKGTELLGPVAVKASDVTGTAFAPITAAEKTGDEYYVFNSVDEMKEAIKLATCKESKTVSYVQLVMNKKNGTKVNSMVTVTAITRESLNSQEANTYSGDATKEYIYVAVPQAYAAGEPTTYGWYVPDNVKANKDFVKSGSFTVEPASHKTENQKTTTEVTKKPTCQEEGLEVTKTVCTDCNKVISSSEKVLPKVTDPIEINKAQVQDPAYPTDHTKTVDKVYFDADDENGANTKHKSNHWIKDFKVTSTTNGTVTTKTTTYTCNFDHVHDELTKVETIKKTDLQGSGKWNLVTWGTDYTILNTTKDAAGTNLFGNTVEIDDSDIDDATLPLNRTAPTADPVFKFATATDMHDGTFTYAKELPNVNVYASNSTLPKQKTYQAVLTVKNVNYAKFGCLEGSATIEVKVYEATDKYTTADSFIAADKSLDAKKLDKALEDGKVTLIQTYTKDVVIPARFNHTYTSGATVCDICGTSRESAQTKAQIFTADTITVTNPTFTGSPVLPKIVVKDIGGNLLIEGIDYEWGVEDKTATAVGEYTLVVKGKGDYVGNRINKTYQILPASTPAPTAKKQTLKVSVAKKTFKVKNLKKKAQKFTTKLSGAKTAVTWKSSNAKVTVKGSKKKATITVKKGTKKGTYKVTATAKKTGAYKKGTVTVKVVVK